MESYIVRIYRRAAEDLPEAVGTLEVASTGQRLKFQGQDELISLLGLAPIPLSKLSDTAERPSREV